jgi:hypothetical protein
MSHQRALFWVVVLMAAIGLLDSQLDGRGAEAVIDAHLLAALAISYLCFRWYCSDSDARGYRRSRWLSVGVAACAFCAIPYYLVRSRSEAERGAALMAYAAYLSVTAFAVWVGMAIHIGLA